MGHHRDEGAQRVGNRHVPADAGAQGALEGVGHEREVACHPLYHAQRQGVHVGSAVQRQALGLLRRGVPGGADHPTAAVQLTAGDPGEGLSQPEVGDAEASVLSEQEVGRLDVPMDDALSVGVVQGPAGLEGDHQHLRRTEGAARREDAPEAAATQVLGHQVGLSVDPPVVDGHHVGIGQRRHEAGLGPEPLHERLVADQRGMQHLDRHLPTQREVVGQVDGARTAGSDGVAQAIPPAQQSATHALLGRASRP